MVCYILVVLLFTKEDDWVNGQVNYWKVKNNMPKEVTRLGNTISVVYAICQAMEFVCMHFYVYVG